MTHEDVPGIVIEPGTRTTRLGVSGDVAPMCVVPSVLLKLPNGSYEFEIPVIGQPPEGAEVITPVVDGVLQDFDAASHQWSWLAEKRLGMLLADQPLTVTEEPWAPQANRQQLLETAFEKLSVPLFQVLKSPLAAMFESGRSSALVVSVGAGITSAVPVVEGIVRAKAATHTRFAGDFVDVHLLAQLKQAQENLVPHYQVQQRQLRLELPQAVNDEQCKLLPRGSTSFHNYQVSRMLNDLKGTCLTASVTPLRGPEIKGTMFYEFPSGFNLLLGPERVVAVESLFQPAMSPLPDGMMPSINSLGLSDVVYQTLQKVDAPSEIVDNLTQNIVLHGGSSQIPELAQRLENDLQNMMPNFNPRIFMLEGHPVWTGASVLASLNEFDESTWITKQQYEELGVQHFLE